jgi:long-chain acyl-CoA synthetase
MDKPWFAHYEPQVPYSLTYPQITLQQMLEDSARNFPDNSALHLVLRYVGPNSIGGRMTYRQLNAEADRFAAALCALGVQKGDRVALMLPNVPQFVIAFYGTLKLGAIVVNTNPQYTPPEIQHQFADAGADAVDRHEGVGAGPKAGGILFIDQLRPQQQQLATVHRRIFLRRDYRTFDSSQEHRVGDE